MQNSNPVKKIKYHLWNSSNIDFCLGWRNLLFAIDQSPTQSIAFTVFYKKCLAFKTKRRSQSLTIQRLSTRSAWTKFFYSTYSSLFSVLWLPCSFAKRLLCSFSKERSQRFVRKGPSLPYVDIQGGCSQSKHFQHLSWQHRNLANHMPHLNTLNSLATARSLVLATANSVIQRTHQRIQACRNGTQLNYE